MLPKKTKTYTKKANKIVLVSFGKVLHKYALYSDIIIFDFLVGNDLWCTQPSLLQVNTLFWILRENTYVTCINIGNCLSPKKV